jgi:glycosyltransferase involved in cell wall biosynthesis
MKTVLHVASHMGGGVGKVLSNVATYASNNYRHHIILLEKPIDTCFTDKLSRSLLTIAPSIDEIRELIGWSDIVQFDWWNHPLLAKVMYDVQDLPMRSVVWAHTSGCYYPQIWPEFVRMPNHFIFSSHCSKENPYWSLAEQLGMRCSVVNSSGGFATTQDVKRIHHGRRFNIGYVGTIDFSKLLPEFVEYCAAAASIPGIQFVMIGRVPEPNLILEQAEKAGIADKFIFKGYVKDLPDELAHFDVMGYLLNPRHYGTTENAMLEAMSMRIPVIAMDQCAEKYLIKNYQTGLLVKNKIQYASALRSLFDDPEMASVLGESGRKFVLLNFGLEKTVHKLETVYNSVMETARKCMPVRRVFGDTPCQWYMSGLPPGDNSPPFNYITGFAKSSVAQWHRYFPEDKHLAAMVK